MTQWALWHLTDPGNYSGHKNNCQKIQPAHAMITKRDFTLRGSCFCEEYRYSVRCQTLTINIQFGQISPFGQMSAH